MKGVPFCMEGIWRYLFDQRNAKGRVRIWTLGRSIPRTKTLSCIPPSPSFQSSGLRVSVCSVRGQHAKIANVCVNFVILFNLKE